MKRFFALFRRPAPQSTGIPPLPRPSPLEAALIQLEASQSAADLASFAAHYSGYLRQAAIARCVALNTPALLPIVASRLNDWVPQVRDAARAAIFALAPACSAAELLGILPAIMRLRNARRTEHAAWIATFEALLASQLAPQDLRAAIASKQIALSRVAFQVARDNGMIPAEALIALALGQRNDIVLAQGTLPLIRELPAALRRPWYDKLARSHFLVLRVESLRVQLSQDGETADALAMAALHDKTVSMRAVAISYLRRRNFDVRGFYRKVLLAPNAPGRLTRIALDELGAVRDKDDLALIQQFVRAPGTAVRQSALAAWLRLAPASKDDIALLALADPAPALRRFALAVVRKHRAYIPFDQAYAILTALRDRLRLLQLAQSDQWRWLETLVQLALDRELNPDPEPGTTVATTILLRDSARQWLQHAGQYYAPPAARQMSLFALPASQRALQELGISDAWLHPF
jgi:hypothetical protein